MTLEDYETLKYGFISFKHLLDRKEVITAANMVNKILSVYDKLNPRTAEIIRVLTKYPKVTYYNNPNYLTP